MERQELIDRIKKLPQDRVAEVAEFVDSLAQRERNSGRANLHQALSDYALEHAGTIADLDLALEDAATISPGFAWLANMFHLRFLISTANGR